MEVSVGLGFGYDLSYRFFVDVTEDAGRMVAEPHLALVTDCQRTARQVGGAVGETNVGVFIRVQDADGCADSALDGHTELAGDPVHACERVPELVLGQA